MPNEKLDAYGIRILALLQKNGRIKKVNLPSQMGLSLGKAARPGGGRLHRRATGLKSTWRGW
jgi:hypothetical protein